MPAVPIPQQVPIAGASWSTGLSPGGIGEAAGAVGHPENPILAGQNIAGMQAQQALQGAQAKNALTDVQQKSRGMQASMLGALANLPPDQYEAQKATTIGAINKLNPSWQIDPNIDQQTAKMNAMAGIPVQEQPAYQMQTYKNPYIQQQIAQSFGGGNQQSGQPTENGVAEDPRLTEAHNASLLGMNDLAQTDIKRYEADPHTKELQKEQEESGGNLADAQKTFNVAFSNLPRAMQRFQEVRDAADNASYGTGTDTEGKGYGPNFAKTSLGGLIEPKTAGANQTIDTAISQGMISELGPQLQGLKGNKYLESIAGGATGLKRDDPPAVKKQAVNQIQDQYVATLKSLAAQRRTYGDKNVPTDAEIDAAVAQNAPKTASGQASAAFGNNRGGNPQSIANAPIIKTQADFDKLPSGAAYIEIDKSGIPHQVWKP
jgi:hypothetical protein